MKALKHLLIVGAGLIVLGSSALAQDYPNKPVKFVVGFTPGGAPDFIARTFGQPLGDTFGQQFVVENKPGAGGTIGAALVAKAPGDGYTLFIGDTGTVEMAQYLFNPPPYDTLRDFTPIGIVATTPVIFLSSSKSQIRTIKDLIREAKANPGKVNYGSSGVGGIHHLIFEAFSTAAGVKMTHIPYKGSSFVLAGLFSREVDVMLTSLQQANAHRQAGTINLLAVSSVERYPFAPDVPSVAEDLKGFDFSVEMGILAPAGLPPDVLAKLSKAIKAAGEIPDMQEKYKKAGLVLTWTTPEVYRDRIRQNLKKYEQVIRTANIQAN